MTLPSVVLIDIGVEDFLDIGDEDFLDIGPVGVVPLEFTLFVVDELSLSMGVENEVSFTLEMS